MMRYRPTPIELLVVIFIIIIIFSLTRGVMVSEMTAIKALDDAGYTNIVVEDRANFFVGLRGGDKSDVARFTCRATNPAGKEVTVYVFAGWPFKGATVRSL